jgi:abhydrolase domain-containing protein 4/abhydrolase domain-containing protein 5
MVHGHGAGLGIFYRNYDALAEEFTIYALDLPGWGRSSRPAKDLPTPEAVRDWWVDALEQWREAVGLERFTLFGHSLGGFVATSYALTYPDRIDHLILSDVAGVTPPVIWKDGVYFHLTPQRIVRLAGPFGPRLVASSRSDQAHLPGADRLNAYFYQLSAAPPSGERLFLRLIGITTWHLPLADRLGALDMPTTIFWGEDDVLTHPRNAEIARDRVAGSVLITIPNAGHIPFLDQAEVFNEAVRSRVKEITRSFLEP